MYFYLGEQKRNREMSEGKVGAAFVLPAVSCDGSGLAGREAVPTYMLDEGLYDFVLVRHVCHHVGHVVF